MGHVLMGDARVQVGLAGQDSVAAAGVEAHRLLLGGQDHGDGRAGALPGHRRPTARGGLDRGDHPGSQPRTAAGATHGQPSQVHHARMPGVQQDAAGGQRRPIRSSGEHVDRGGQIITGIDLQGEGHVLLPDEDLQADVGRTGADGVRGRARRVARAGLEAARLDDGLHGRDQKLRESRVRCGQRHCRLLSVPGRVVDVMIAARRGRGRDRPGSRSGRSSAPR